MAMKKKLMPFPGQDDDVHIGSRVCYFLPTWDKIEVPIVILSLIAESIYTLRCLQGRSST